MHCDKLICSDQWSAIECGAVQCQAAGNRLVPQIRGSIFSAIQLLGQFIWNSLRSWAVYQPNLCSLGVHTFVNTFKNMTGE